MPKKPLRIFLDSNVILSGLLSDKGSPRIILDLLSLKTLPIKGLTGTYNILEIERNLAKKLPKALPAWKHYLPKMDLEIVPLPTKRALRHFTGLTAEKDIPVLASAAQGKADYLVTGDKKDFGTLKMKDLPFAVLNPSEFLENLEGKIRENSWPNLA